MMRKIIVIFSLIALLTFVFPAAASDTAPSFDRGDGGSVMVQLVYVNELFTSYFSEIWQTARSEQLREMTESNMMEAKIIGRWIALIQEMLQGQFSPSN